VRGTPEELYLPSLLTTFFVTADVLGTQNNAAQINNRGLRLKTPAK
jgi:hypothetical protein